MRKKITLLILFISSLSFSQVIVSKKLQDPENKIIQKLTKRSQIWISGEWTEKNNKYIWKKGYWTQKKPGYIYIQGYWEKRKNGWIWRSGNWKKINIQKWNTVYS